MLRMPEDRENELVLQAQKGSTKAFTELEKQYHWLVFMVAKGILREAGIPSPHIESEDVTQDVFEYAFEHIKEYKPGRFYRWLWGLTKNMAMRARRKIWRRMDHECEYDDEYREGWDSMPSDVDAMAAYVAPGFEWELGELESAVEDLPKRQREDVKAYAEGEKPREIAKRTGRKLRAVDKSIERAKRSVKMSQIRPSKAIISIGGRDAKKMPRRANG